MPLRPCPGQNTRAVPACLWLSSGRGLQNTKLQKNTTSSPQSRRSLPLRALLRIWCALLGAASPLWGQTPDGQPLRNGLYRDAEGSTSASSLPGAGQGSRVTTAAALGIGSAGVESGSTGAPSADVNTAHSLDDREQRRRHDVAFDFMAYTVVPWNIDSELTVVSAEPVGPLQQRAEGACRAIKLTATKADRVTTGILTFCRSPGSDVNVSLKVDLQCARYRRSARSHRWLRFLETRESSMSDFIVVSFPDEATARQGMEGLTKLKSEHFVVHGAGIVTKDDRGTLSMQILADDGLSLVGAGALLGGLAGSTVGLMAAAVMATGGAMSGLGAALTHRGAGKRLMENVGRRLKAGSAALVADVDASDKAAVKSRMEALGGAVANRD